MRITSALVARFGAIAKQALASLAALLRGLSPRARTVARLAVIGCCALAAVIALVSLAAGSGGRRDDPRPAAQAEPIAEPVRPVRAAATVPDSGPALASMLLIPGEGKRPWPLALEPKARYTDADAAELSPDLGAVDIGDLSRRRKAALETIYGAVD